MPPFEAVIISVKQIYEIALTYFGFIPVFLVPFLYVAYIGLVVKILRG